MTKLSNPVPLFLDTRGALMDNGHIYVGVAFADPHVSPINLFWDAALTIPATQPLRTIGGLIVNVTTPAAVFFAETDFSMRATDKNDVLCFYSPSVYTDAADFQPIDTDLTTISNQTNAPYGLALLQLANQAALRSATGIPDCLPLAGGTVTGNIYRQGVGVYPYWADAHMTGGRIFETASGAADPTALPGDIWFTY